MRKIKKVICEKCGKRFVKASGGFVPDFSDNIRICPECRKNDLKGIWNKTRKNKIGKLFISFVKTTSIGGKSNAEA